MTEQVKVEQSDRDAAAALAEFQRWNGATIAAIQNCERDTCVIVQSFARHRLASQAQIVADMAAIRDAAEALLAKLDDMLPASGERPTIAELEAMLTAAPGSVEMKPDGSIHVMPRTEIEALRAALTPPENEKD